MGYPESLADLAQAAVSSFSMRNILHNGDFRVQQRGSGFSGVVESQVTFDRWRATIGGASGVNVIDGGPFAGLSKNSVRVGRSSGTGSFGLYQSIERAEFERLKGRTVTFSGVLLKDPGIAGSIVASIRTVTAEGGTTAVDTGSISIDTASMAGVTPFKVSLAIPAGSAAQGLLVQIAANSQAGGESVGFYATCLQLEVGQVATPYEWRPSQIELDLCRRFYQAVYAHWSGDIGAGTAYSSGGFCPVPMRAVPTCVSVGDGPNANFPLAAIGDIQTYFWQGMTHFVVTRTASGTGVGTYGGAYSLSAEI